MAILHDVYRLGVSQNVAYAAAGGASAVSTPFGNETYWIQVCAVAGAAVTFTSGARIVIGDNPTFNILSGTYVSVSGLVTLTLSSPHGLSSGTSVVVSGTTGTGVDIASVNGTKTTGAGTVGTTLTFTIATGLTITSITGGKVATGTDPVASATSSLIPLNWLAVIACCPGQKIAVLSNDAVVGSLSVTELTS